MNWLLLFSNLRIPPILLYSLKYLNKYQLILLIAQVIGDSIQVRGIMLDWN